MRSTLVAFLLLASACDLGDVSAPLPPADDVDADVTPPPGDEPDADVPPPATGRVTLGLQAIYEFGEGSGALVGDTSNVGLACDLDIASPGLVTWRPTGLRIDATTIARNGGPATKIYDACTASNEITVEAWVTPASLTTGGVAARIAGMSLDPATRNFSIIQTDADYSFRLRTGATDLNGIPATTAPAAVTILPQHLVYTRDALGQARLYVDNVEKAQAIVGDTFINWAPTYEMVIANEATLNRPWLGELHLVAVYCRALTLAEVGQNFAESY